MIEMSEFAYGVLAGFPAGAALVVLAGKLAPWLRARKTRQSETTLTPEASEVLVGQVMQRRADLAGHADKLADGDPELRKILNYQAGV